MDLPKEMLEKCIAAGATFGPVASIDPPKEVKKRSKYRNVKTVIDNRTFDSKKEASRYVTLRLAEQCGTISNLECQPVYEIVVAGVKVAKYLADFRYVRDGVTVIEDVKSKGTKTAVYRLKKKLVEAIHQIEITEV